MFLLGRRLLALEKPELLGFCGLSLGLPDGIANGQGCDCNDRYGRQREMMPEKQFSCAKYSVDERMDGVREENPGG